MQKIAAVIGSGVRSVLWTLCLERRLLGLRSAWCSDGEQTFWWTKCLVRRLSGVWSGELHTAQASSSLLPPQCRYLYRLHTLLLQSLCIGFKEKLLWTSKGGTALLEHACQCFVSFTFLRWKDYVDIPFKGGLMKNAEKKDIRS